MRRPTPFSPLLASLAVAAATAGLASQQPQGSEALPPDRRGGAEAVNVEACKTWLGKLASPEFGGRGTGQDGFRLAADYVRDQFIAMRLLPGAAGGSWFQDLPWSKVDPVVAEARLTFRRGEKEVVVPGERLSGSVQRAIDATGEVVVLTSLAEDAISAADLTGKVVIVAGASEEGFRAMRALQGKNAAAVLLAQPAAVTSGLRGAASSRRNRADQGRGARPTALSFGGEDLTALLALDGLTALPAERTVLSLPVTATLSVPVTESMAPACNVVGILPGSDPARAHEYVVIGSHLDHLGRRSSSQFFPGADDDGSGTTGVLAVAMMMARNKTRPARSILFVCFCGEEMGLLGSAHFAQNPPIPLASIVGELQMDMIGRDEEENSEGNSGEKAEDNRNTLHVIGTKKLAPQLHELCMQKNAAACFELEWDQEGMFGRSDHANFARMGVPIAFFFTGLHGDYHKTTDTPDKIHYEKLLRVATYVYDIAFELAQQSDRPRIDPALWDAYKGKGNPTPAAPMLAKDGEAAPSGTDKSPSDGNGKPPTDK